MGGKNEFFENFERNKYLKKLPSMQRVKIINDITKCPEASIWRKGLRMYLKKRYYCIIKCLRGEDVIRYKVTI